MIKILLRRDDGAFILSRKHLQYLLQSIIFATSLEHQTRKRRAESRNRQIFYKTMKKADFTIRLVLRPSRLDPDRAAVQATLRLSDGRRMYFTAKSSVPTYIARDFFDSTGRPWNPEKYDKRTYNILRGMYTSLQDAIMDILAVDCTPVEEVTREAVKKDFDANLAIWNKNHAGREWQ